MKMPLPCDYELLNFRTSLMGSLPAHHKSEAVLQEIFNAKKLLILRRRRTECIYGSIKSGEEKKGAINICDEIENTDGLNLTRYFLDGFDIAVSKPMSLSGVKVVTQGRSQITINIKPMEIKTVDVQFVEAKGNV